MEFNEAVESLKLKFISGNSIPVERATIIKDEWRTLSIMINALKITNEVTLLNQKMIADIKDDLQTISKIINILEDNTRTVHYLTKENNGLNNHSD